MFQGSWKCSSCGGEITELPFEPKSEKGLVCRTCFMKQKNGENQAEPDMAVASEVPDIPDEAGLAGEPAPTEDLGETAPPAQTERKMFSGEWKCGDCGTAITSLPFEPRETGNLKCIDCFKKSKGN